MPVLDGCDATKQIRDFLHFKGLMQPVVIGVTGQTEDSYLERAYQSGMNQVSAKPVDV